MADILVLADAQNSRLKASIFHLMASNVLAKNFHQKPETTNPQQLNHIVDLTHPTEKKKNYNLKHHIKFKLPKTQKDTTTKFAVTGPQQRCPLPKMGLGAHHREPNDANINPIVE